MSNHRTGDGTEVHLSVRMSREVFLLLVALVAVFVLDLDPGELIGLTR